jgi:A nuclease family of the HNH/ENDO VII superfamily with conserved AHH
MEEYVTAFKDKLNLNCALSTARELINPETLMSLADVSMLFMGVNLGPGGRAATSTSKCAVEQLRVNMNPKTTQLDSNAKTRINRDYGGNVNDNLYENIADADWGKGSRSTKPKETSPHHIVPKKEFDPARCLRQGQDVCQGSRDILDRVGLDYNDGCNGVFLPYNKTAPIHSTFPKAQIHNRTDFHDLTYYGKVFDILNNLAGNFAPSMTKAERKAKVCEELQVTAYRLLTGQL